ncbi:MAG: hypothetical protein H0V44_02540 [Planctomycetes bacterium]|nr:hypothetical protein [Planctomycetota bacterium]
MKTRNLVALILGACFAGLAAIGIGGFVLFKTVSGMIAQSEPVTLALATVSREPLVVDRVGPPLTARLLGGTITIRSSGSAGHAEMDSDCVGSKNHVRVIMSADKVDGVWRLDRLAYVLDGERHEVLPAPRDSLRSF